MPGIARSKLKRVFILFGIASAFMGLIISIPGIANLVKAREIAGYDYTENTIITNVIRSWRNPGVSVTFIIESSGEEIQTNLLRGYFRANPGDELELKADRENRIFVFVGQEAGTYGIFIFHLTIGFLCWICAFASFHELHRISRVSR